MLFPKNNFIQQRKKSLYEREIGHILHRIVREYNLPSLSLSYCELSRGGENVKIYLFFSQEESQEKVLNLINKNYSYLVKKELARRKKFSHIPNLVFLPDKELEIKHSLDKILKESL